MEKIEVAKWGCRYRLEKREGDINACKTPEERLKFLEEVEPYEVIEGEGNLLLNEGMDRLLNLLIGGGGTAYNNTNARIGVGNGTVAAARTQTGLQGTSTLYKGMEAGFPTSPAENDAGTGRSVKFKSSFGDTEANWAWEEWAVDNGSVALEDLNRKVKTLGTKSGGTWTLEVEISLS